MSGFLKNILYVLVSFMLGIASQYYFFEKSNEIQKLDVRTNFDSNYLSKPKFPDSKVEIKVDGDTKESIGILEISLVNFSNTVLKDIPVIIEVTPKRGGLFSYLSHFAHGEKGVLDLVEISKPYEFVNGTHRFFYTVKSFNRSDGDDIGMKLGILFEGDQKPDVTVSAVGLSTRDFDIEHSPARTKANREAWIMFITVLAGLLLFMFAIFVPLLSRLTSPLDKIISKKNASETFKIMRLDPYYASLTDNDLKQHVADVLYKRQRNWWNDKSILGKWLLGMKGPEFDDYRF